MTFCDILCQERVKAVVQISRMGSGSLEQNGPLSIVAMQKKEQARFVHEH